MRFEEFENFSIYFKFSDSYLSGFEVFWACGGII